MNLNDAAFWKPFLLPHCKRSSGMRNEGLEGLNEALETTNACSGSELTYVTDTLGHSILSYFLYK